MKWALTNYIYSDRWFFLIFDLHHGQPPAITAKIRSPGANWHTHTLRASAATFAARFPFYPAVLQNLNWVNFKHVFDLLL